MSTIYAKIDSGVVTDIILASADDLFDPSFTWVDLTDITPQPQINWLYDGENFQSPGLRNDIYGNAVTKATDGVHDIYTNAMGLEGMVAAGASDVAAYVAMAKQVNFLNAMDFGRTFIQSRYSDNIRMNMIGLVLNAQIEGLANRLNYLKPLLTWQNSIIGYLATYVVSVQSQVTESGVAALSPDFNPFIATDPLLTAVAAIQIPD